MGLLSRFGAGLVKAAPIMGQMAQSSLLEEQKAADRTYLEQAETTKHNRLLGREKKAFERLTSAADTKWNRELKALEIKRDDAIKLAQSTGQATYYKDALKIQSDLMQKEIETQRHYLQTGQFEVTNPETQEKKFKAYEASVERLRAAQETYNNLDSQYRLTIGLPPSLGLDTEDFDINAAVNMAAEEIVRSGEEEDPVGLISVPTMTDQVKSINDMLERNKMPIMTPEQETSFRELVEAQVRGIGGQQMPDQVSTALGLEPEVSIYEQQKAASAAKELEGSVNELDRALYGGKDPTKYIEGTPEAISAAEIASAEEGPLIYAGMAPGSIGVDFPRLGEAIVSGAKAAAPYLAWKGGVGGKPRGKRLLKAVEDEASDDSIAKILETDKKDALRNLNSIISREFEESTYQATTVLGAIMALLNAGWDVERVINEIKSAEELQDETSFNTPDDAMIRDLIDSFSKPARA